EDHVPGLERVLRPAPVEDAGAAARGHEVVEVGLVERVGVEEAGEEVEAGAAALEHEEEVAGAGRAAEAEAGLRPVAALHPGGRDPLPGAVRGGGEDGVVVEEARLG